MDSKWILTLALGCLLSLELSFAQEESLPFVRIGRDPVAGAMGFAGAANSSETAYSSFRNVSVIPLSENRLSAGFSYQNWAPDGVKSSNMNLGASFKAGRFGFAIGGAYQAGDEYSIVDATGASKGTFKPNDLLVNGGVAFGILDDLSAGVNVRYASQKLTSEDSYSAVCADVFLTYRLSGLNVTAGVSSLGSSVKSASGDSFSLPASATIGADWTGTFSESHGVRVAADVDYFFSGNLTVAAGAQYSFKDMVFARAGYHFGTKNAVLPSFATVGLGVKFFGVSVDVAYLTANEALGNTLTVGLGYRF